MRGRKISRFSVTGVSGHGSSAGNLTASLRPLIRKHINTLDQMRFASALNQEFSRLAQTKRFSTALLTTYFAPTEHLIVCNAGHPCPLWYHASSGSWGILDKDTPRRAEYMVNLPLSIVAPTNYEQFAVQLGKGDLVIFLHRFPDRSRRRPTGRGPRRGCSIGLGGST